MAINPHRPLSPHLQVYRLPLTGLISITHRMTGIFLAIGLPAIVYILFTMADSGQAFLHLQMFLQHWPVLIVYWGFLYALCFHLCHGIRHLFWDAGAGFEKQSLNYWAGIELIASIALFCLLLFI